MIWLDKAVVSPLEAINISVPDVNDICTVYVTLPTGSQQVINAAITDHVAATVYTPSYAAGTYQVYAVADGTQTETDQFVVASGSSGKDIIISNWAADSDFYFPGRTISFSMNLGDSDGAALGGFSTQIADTRFDSDSGALLILREIRGVQTDGTVTARIGAYFDTTGRWSDIYAGTRVEMSLYYRDGTPLPSDFQLNTGLENVGGQITNQLVEENGIDRFITDVNANFGGADRISYLDIVIPPGRSLSDVVFSVDYIKYYYNSGWNDRIYIGENFVNTTGSGMEFSAGSVFGSLGRFPVFLPLTPDESGLVYYAVDDVNLGTDDIHDGTMSQVSGTYTNAWKWNDYIQTTATFSVYGDKWGYQSHGFATGIILSPDPVIDSTALDVSNWSASPSAYAPGENITFSFDAADTAGTPITGLTGTLADPQPNYTGGALLVRRIVKDVFADGSSQARLQLCFDTTGGWSGIKTGTKIIISIYNADGIGALSDSVGLRAGFENDDNSSLSAAVEGNVWTVNVDKDFSGIDKVAYLDFDIPADLSVSDIVFSVDYIKYFRDAGWGDTINIAGRAAGESAFAKDLFAQIEFKAGDTFPGLGRFPLILTLNPNPNGFVFYGFRCSDLPERDINYGTLSETDGTYSNVFRWDDYIITSAEVFSYIDKWGYRLHAVSDMISIDFDDAQRELALVDFDIDKRGYTKNETRQFTVRILDGLAAGISGFRLKDNITNSNNGKLSIVTQNFGTDADGNNVVRLLLYFDSTGQWSSIYTGTKVNISLYGADGKSAVGEGIAVIPGMTDADGLLSYEFAADPNAMKWDVSVVSNFSGVDTQAYLDFVFDDDHSPSEVVFAIDHISYNCQRDWADNIVIRNVDLPMNQFPVNEVGDYEFVAGSWFGSLGKFPLYLTLTPGGKSIFVKMKSSEATEYVGTMTESGGLYTYSHMFSDDRGLDFETSFCITQFGYFDNKYKHTDPIMLYFTAEPRYLGGLATAAVLLGDTWQVDLRDHLFVQLDYDNVEYSASEPNNIIIEGSVATFSPTHVDQTVEDLVFTARSKTDPALVASSEAITLIAAQCLDSYGCDDGSGRTNACLNYKCQYYEMESSWQKHPQGVDLSVLNNNLTMSDLFPEPGQDVQISAEVFNTGTTNIFDVTTYFYLDDTNGQLIDVNEISVIPATYFGIPFRSQTARINWTVPQDLRGRHRIWVEVAGRYPLDMQEDMISNNFATLDFYVGDPNDSVVTIDTGSCPIDTTMNKSMSIDPNAIIDRFIAETNTKALRESNCRTVDMIVPITVRVCEDELVCGPVIGYELSYWNTIYWPSWSGYCQEFDVPQEFFTDFIRTYERLVGLGSQGAGSSLPSLGDFPGLLKPPDGWSDGWLPCHPEPTLFWYILYEPGVLKPDCGGLCPVSAWDCGQGVHFQPRFDSPLYNAYQFKVSGGARVVTRCRDEGDYIRIPVRVCDPDDPVGPWPINIPFDPFDGSPGDNGTGGGGGGGGGGGPGSGDGPGYGGNGPSTSGSGSGNPPFTFTITDETTDSDGTSLPMDCYFCSTGTKTTNRSTDMIHCVPVSGGPRTGVAVRKGWNLISPALEPVEERTDRIIPLRLGWNLFGYSNNVPFAWSQARIRNQSQTLSVDQAHAAGWIQSTIFYIDKGEQVYKFIPGDDVALRNNNSYWLYAAQDGLELILPAAGGSAASQCFSWIDATVTDGVAVLSVDQAQTAGWIDATLYYLDPAEQAYHPVTAGADMCAWQGYWFRSNRNDLRLITVSGDVPVKMMASNDTESLQDVILQPAEKSLYTAPTADFPTIGRSAPDIVLKDINGNTVRLSEHTGRDILLVFGTTHCPYCAAKVKLLNEMAANPELSGFEVIFVALGANRDATLKYAQQNDIQFTILPDPLKIAGRRYRITSVPTAYVIDCDSLVQSSTVYDGDVLWDILAAPLSN